MEINTPSTIEYNQNISDEQILQGNISDEYITFKSSSPFDDIRTKLLEIISFISDNKEPTFEEQLNEKFLNLDFGSEFDIDSTKIGINDAIFFVNLLNQNNIINYTVQDDKISLNVDDKAIKTSNSLLNMLHSSIETKKAIRLDFDKDVTVILKLDKEGKILTHFIPGSFEVESFLKQNIPCLRQRFDDAQINYSQIAYSRYKGENNNSNNQRKKRSNQ